MPKVPLASNRVQPQARPAVPTPRGVTPQDLTGGTERAIAGAAELLVKAREEARRLNYTEAKSQRSEQLQGLMDEYHQLGQKEAMEKYQEYMGRLDDIWNESASFFDRDSKTAQFYNAERGVWDAAAKARINAHFNGEKNKYLRTNEATSQKNAMFALRDTYFDSDLARNYIQDHEKTIAVVDGELGLTAEDTIANILEWRGKAYEHMLSSAFADEDYDVLAGLLEDTAIKSVLSPERLAFWNNRTTAGNQKKRAYQLATTMFSKAQAEQNFSPENEVDLRTEIRDEVGNNPDLAAQTIGYLNSFMADQRVKVEAEKDKGLNQLVVDMHEVFNSTAALDMATEFGNKYPDKRAIAMKAWTARYGSLVKAQSQEQFAILKRAKEISEEQEEMQVMDMIDGGTFVAGVNPDAFRAHIAGFSKPTYDRLVQYFEQGGIEGAPKLWDRTFDAAKHYFGSKAGKSAKDASKLTYELFDYVKRNIKRTPGQGPVTDDDIRRMVHGAVGFLAGDVVIAGDESRNRLKTGGFFAGGVASYRFEDGTIEEDDLDAASRMTGLEAFRKGLDIEARPTIESLQELQDIRDQMIQMGYPVSPPSEELSNYPLQAEEEFKRQVILGLPRSLQDPELARRRAGQVARIAFSERRAAEERDKKVLNNLSNLVSGYRFVMPDGTTEFRLEGMKSSLKNSAYNENAAPDWMDEAITTAGQMEKWVSVLDGMRQNGWTQEQIGSYIEERGLTLLRDIEQ